jgi:ligand-binding sensor domain-containing protein/serine phosphatase RsbU (regulator of sigma subunit)
MKKLWHLCILLCLISASPAGAQYAVKNFPNLLPKKNTPFYCIAQDRNGYLWMGSKEGLVKFDGQTAQVFGQRNGLPAVKITSVYCDSTIVWIGTDNGKVYRIGQSGQADSLVFKTEAPDNKITGFYKSGNRLFVSTYGNGVYLFESNEQTDRFTSKNGLTDDVVYTLKFLNNKLWCGTDAGIAIISNLNGKPAFEAISTKLGLPDNIVRSINYYSPTKLVIGMQDSGLCFFNTEKKEFEKIIFFSNWDKGAVISCQVNDNSDLVFATEKKGLFLFKEGQLHSEEFAASLKTSSFYQLFIDRFNSIWLTSDLGVHQIAEKRFEIINSSKGLTDEKILSVICDNDQGLWAGTSHGIIRIIKNENNSYSFLTVPDFPKVTVSCSAIDEDGVLYFGTYESGIIVIKDGKLFNYNTHNSQLSNDNVSNIFISGGKVYVSTLGGGLVICRIEEGKLSVLKNYTEKDGLKSDYIYSALVSGDDLYVTSDGGGLEILNGDLFRSLNQELKLSSTTVYSLAKDSKGNVWGVTNADGVIKYNGKSVEFFRTKTGLRDEQPQQIIEYKGTVYLIHSKGIDKIDLATSQVSYYDVMEGDLEPNLNSVFIKDGVLYSATNNGILSYRIRPVSSDKIKPVALITKLMINYKPSSLDSSGELRYNQNNLSIEFNGIWTKNPEKLVFRYQLKGFEKDWKYTSFAQLINYNNLDAGDYTFVVQSKNDEDVWSDPAEYKFSIAAPIWKSAWFWIITTLSVAFAIYFFFKWRIRALQKENLVLEEKVAQRTHEIEKQSEIIAAANKELEQLSIVASRTDNVVLILSPNGDIEYVNESFSRLNNISLQEIQEKKMNIFASSNNPRIKDYVADAVSNRRSVKYESLNEKNPHNLVWEASTLTPIFDEQDNLRKLIIIDSDITQSKRQQKIIEQKNKDITDSIEYARKIQTAILPSRDKIHKSLPNSFVFYKTKDIVSGDFYWFSEKEDFCIIAAIDCTGHGVPGAFMSLIGYNILNKVVNENNTTDPALILKNLNLGVLDALHSNQNSDSKDGMDAAICKIYFNENRIDYAGAMRPLWIVNGENVTEIKADKIPIGTKQDAHRPEISYTTHTLNPNKDDVFYIFTDGYADQFGGERGKKMGSARFKELLVSIQKMNFDIQEQRVKEEHLNWKQDNEQVDDLCVIGFRR